MVSFHAITWSNVRCTRARDSDLEPLQKVRRDGVRCDVCGVLVRCMCSGLAGKLPLVARVALLVCIGGLTFIVCVGAFGSFAVVPTFLCLPRHGVSL